MIIVTGMLLGVVLDRLFIFYVLSRWVHWRYEKEDVYISSVSDTDEVMVDTSSVRRMPFKDTSKRWVSSSSWFSRKPTQLGTADDVDDAWSLQAAAFWNRNLRAVRMQALQRREMVSPEEAKCQTAFCIINKRCEIMDGEGQVVAEGETWITMGSEEFTPVGNDHGAMNIQEQFAAAHNSTESFYLFPMLTVHIECLLKTPTPTIHEDLYLRAEMEHSVILSGGIAVPPKRKLHKKLAVCGRAIVGKYEAKDIALHIENNMKYGVEVLLLYKVGLSSIRDEEIFRQYILSGHLAIIDLRSELQRRHGFDSNWVVWNTKGFMQSYLRKDCMDRLAQHDVDWVGFLDFDEFMTFNLMETVEPGYDAVKVVMLEPKDTSRFCRSKKKRLQPGIFKGGLTKPFLRPSVIPFDVVSVHSFQNYLLNVRTKLLDPEKDGFIYHNRCINHHAYIGDDRSG